MRLCAFLLCAAWLSTAAFHVLISIGAFRLPAGLALAFLATIICCRDLRRNVSKTARLRSEILALGDSAVAIVKSAPILVSLAALLVLVRLCRGLAAPPLAWDMLTYHLVKVARWIRTGGLAPELAPDRWDGYEYFPYGGDALWAWAMLPFHGDAPLAFACVLVWLAALVTVYALARELGADGRMALIGALALVLNPSSASFVTSGYVENTSLFFLLAGALFVVRVLAGTASSFEPALAVAAFSLAAGVKASGLPLLALALVTLAVASLVRRSGRIRPAAIWIISIALIAGLPPYARALLDRGSTVYPHALRIAGRTLAEGHPMTLEAVRGTLDRSMGYFTPGNLIWDLLHRRADRDLLNPGWGGALLAVLGVAGIVVVLRRGPRPVVAFLAAFAGLSLALLFSPDTLALRARWSWIIGRFMLPALGSLAALAAASGGTAMMLGLSSAALLGILGSLPHGFSYEDVAAASRVGGLALVGAAVAILAAKEFRRRAGAWASALASAIVLSAVGGTWAAIRVEARPAIWKAAFERRAFELHPFVPAYGSAYVLWQAVDDGVAHRIAVSAGWYPPGDNWFRYPLFGRRLQNDVLYVPVTADGSIVDTRLAASSGRLSREAWVRRLVTRRVDLVVLLAPDPPEGAWVRGLPRLFPTLAVSSDGGNAAFRVDTAAAEAWLARRMIAGT